MIKDILLVVDNHDKDAAIVDAALKLAAANDAHLTVVILGVVPVPGYTMSAFAPYVTLDEYRERTAAKENAVAARAQHAGIAAEIRVVSDVAQALIDKAPVQTRYADLVLFGPADSWDDQWVRRRVVETVLLGSGRPILLVPADGRVPSFRQAVIGWNASMEAARAVAAALPLLTPDAQLTVAVVNPRVAADRHGSEPGADLATHLSRHGHRVEVQVLEAGSGDEAIELGGFAHARGTDLLVLGGYGRSRVRELILGGVTRSMIEHAPCPTLIVR